MSPVVTTIIGAILVFAAGAGLGFWLGNARTKAKTGSVRAEYDAYRAEVARHFGQAAEHFQTIGREYRALYEHMASGAEALCDAEKADKPISFLPADRSSGSVDDDAGDAAASPEANSASDVATPVESADDRADDGSDRPAGGSETAPASAAADGEDDVGEDSSAVAHGDGEKTREESEAAEVEATTRPDRIYH